MDGREARPRLNLDDEEFNDKLDQDKARLAAANSESGQGSMLGAISMGLGALMPGLGGAAAGLGLLGATGGLAFSGVSKALGAAHQASQNVGMTSQQVAAQQFSNSIQVQQAQQSVAQASQQSAQDQIAAAASVEQAQMNLASVERNAAASQIQALQSVQQAEQGQQQATYNLREANYQLSQAYEQARQQIQQLDDQLADSKLNVQSAQLAISQAIYNQKLVDQNAYSTSIDRQQAALAVAQAQQHLKDAQDQLTASQYNANLANQQGVDGSQTVIQAKQGQLSAQYALTDANQSYADAQRNLTLTELNNAQQIKSAQMQVAAAREQAAYQQRQDAAAVANAEQNLTNTIRQQQLQWAAMQSTQNQAANQFAKYFAHLTPAGQAFVTQILGMKTAWKGLTDAAQTAALPGFTAFLQGVATLMPTIQSGVSQMGSAMSGAFASFGQALSSPAAQTALQGLITNGMQFVNVVLPAFGQFFAELGKIGSQQGAASGLANLIVGIAQGLTGLAAAVGQYEGPINSFLSAVGNIIAQIGPPLGRIIGLVAEALGPLTRYLNAHPNGTVAKVIGDIVAGLIAFKGLQKLLPDFLSGPLTSFAGKGGDLLLKPFKTAGEKIPGLLGKAWPAVTGGFSKAFGSDSPLSKTWSSLFGDAGTVPSMWSRVFGKNGVVSSGIDSAKTTVGGLASSFGSKFATMGQSVIGFGAQLGSQMATAAKNMWTWVAENAAAAGSYIAENAAMAVSATAAFVAENAATLGIAAAVAALAAGIVFLATHWQQSWHDIKQWAEDAWNFIYNGIGKYLLPLLGPLGVIALGLIELSQHWSQIWSAIQTAAGAVFSWLQTGAQGLVSGLSDVWDGLETVFKTPVNFLITTVYDNGIRRFWNDVVGSVGLGSLNLPNISPLARGGVIPGYSPGHDVVPIMASPGEAVLTPQATRAIGGASTVNALNAAYPPTSPKPAAGSGSFGATAPGKFGGGGIIGSIAGGISSAAGDVASGVTGAAKGAYHVGKSIVGGAIDTAKLAADFATGNVGAIANMFAQFIGTDAKGALAQVMLGIPKTIVTDIVKAAISFFTGGGGSSGSAPAPGPVSGPVASWFAKAAQLTGVGSGWIPDLEVIAHYESDDNPYSINLTDVNAKAGDPSRGIMQTIMTTFAAYHQPGTSMNIYDPVANIAAAINYIKARYGTVENVPGIRSLASGGNYVGYDTGGWLPPGLPVNRTGRPEAVLTPEESVAFVALVRRLEAQSPPGSGGALGNTVNQYFTGRRLPDPEELAEMKRQLAMSLG